MKSSGTILTLALLVAGLAGRSHAETIIVRPTGRIQDQIDAAANGDLIIALSGIYKGEGNYNINFRGKAITLQSAAGRGSCTIAIGGGHANNRRGFIFHTDETATSVVDGFTITGGFMIDQPGAGILCTGGASPTIRNCAIVNNLALGPLGVGGGIACMYSSPTIADSTIANNHAGGSYGGGGIYCYASNAEITGNLVYGNDTLYDGGGLYCIFGSPVVTLNRFEDNDAVRGGGMCNWLCPSEITNNLFVQNEGNDYGGGLYCRGNPPPTIKNNTFTENGLLGEEGEAFGREIAFYAINADALNSIIWRNDFDTAVAKFEPPDPVVIVTGDDGAIGAAGTDFTAASVPDFTALFPPIDPEIHVVIITNAAGEVTDGTYNIAAVAAGSITLTEQAGTEPDPPGPYGTCSYTIGDPVCEPQDPTEPPEDEVGDVAVLGNSIVILCYSLISIPPDYGSVYVEPGSSYQIQPFIWFLEPIPADEIFVAPGRLVDMNSPPTPCDCTDDTFVDGTDYHLAPGSIGIDSGDRGSDYANEPCDNGGRINLGRYGNTDEATVTGPCPAGATIIIQGPDDRNESLLPPGGGTVTISIWGQDFANFSAVNIGLKFLDNVGAEVDGFEISTIGGDPEYCGLDVAVPEDGGLFTIAQKLCNATPGSRFAGFFCDPVTIGPDIAAQPSTELLTFTCNYTAAVPNGTYTIALDTDTSFVSSDATSHATFTGRLTIGVPLNSAIIIEGPDDRGDPPIERCPEGIGGTVRIDIWAENLLDFAGLQIGLRFLDNFGAPVDGFTLSTAVGDPTYCGIDVVVPEDGAFFVPPIADDMKVCDIGLGFVGFVLGAGADVTIGPDIDAQPRTEMLRITYDYSGDVPDGTYAVELDHGFTVVANGDEAAIPHVTTAGALTITTVLCQGDANDDCAVDILDMIMVRNYLGDDPTSSDEAAAADVNGDGAIDILDMIYVRNRLGLCTPVAP